MVLPPSKEKAPRNFQGETSGLSAKIGLNLPTNAIPEISNNKAIHQCERSSSFPSVGVIRVGDLLTLHKNHTGGVRFV